MKHLTKLALLALLVVFASCQNESVQQNGPEQAPLRFIDGEVVSDGLMDKELVFDENSEILRSPNELFDAKTNNCEPDIDGLEASLPSQVTVTTTSKPGDDAYFNLTISDDSGFLSGTEIPAWCADQDLSLENNETATFDVYSSYGELPADKFEVPENFDKVNWLLNQSIIGTASPNGLGEYTFGHIQYAIWLLIDDSTCQLCTFLTNPTGDWNIDGNDVAKAQELSDLAMAQGGGFVPGCGQLMAIVLVPEGKQSVIITKEVPAEEDCEYTTVTDGECNGCDASMSVSFSCDCQCVEVSACKDLSNIVLLTADGSEVKYEDLDGQTATLCSPDGSPIVSVWVKAGCFRSGDGPGYGRRFDNPNSECAPTNACQDCTGKVTDLTLNWDWHNDYRVRAYQRNENTWHATKIFDQVVGPNEDFSLSGVNQDGTFGKWVYIFVGRSYYTKIKTNCQINIGPGYRRGVIEVVSGQSSLGGELCEYEPPHNWCWWW